MTQETSEKEYPLVHPFRGGEVRLCSGDRSSFTIEVWIENRKLFTYPESLHYEAGAINRAEQFANLCQVLRGMP